MPKEANIQPVELNTQPVELYKIIKFEGLANSGAEAKLLIDEEQVMVNGVVETRRRRKIVDGDVISFNDIELHVTCACDGATD